MLFSPLLLIVLFSKGHADTEGQLRSKRQSHHGIPVKIGGLFDTSDSLEERTLKLAVEQVNHDRNLLPFHQLLLKAETVDGESSFYTKKAVCSLLREGIVGVFGPLSSDGSAHAHSLCDRFEIPHIETRWDYRTRQDKYAINIHPHPDTLGQAYANLVANLGEKWYNFAVLYDEEEGLIKLQNIIRIALLNKRNITVRELPPDDYRPLLKRLQREYQIQNIIVDASVEKTLEVLRQAEQIGMTSHEYSYILTTLDLQADEMDEYKHGDAQFFAFRLVDPERPEVQNISRALIESFQTHRTTWRGAQFPQPQQTVHRSSLTTSQALVFDAVLLFSKALQENSDMIRSVKSLNCNQYEGWTKGSTLINVMRAMPAFQGLTGTVQFNNSGFRTDINLDIVKVTKNGFLKAGTWEYARFTNSRITWLPSKQLEPEEKIQESDLLPLQGRHLNVTTIMTDPFCMYKMSESPKAGNERFEGFTLDMVNELSQYLKFNYTIQLVRDGEYSGMIKEVVDGTGDMVVADLTITEERQRILDFTMPFMNLGISILFVPPQAKPPSLFSFMSPFALEVWIYMAIAFFGVSLVLFIVARVTPLEWDNPLPCITDPDKLHNQFKFSNSIWFTLGSIMQQGSDLAPKAVSTRIIAGIWWFFTLIMVSSYTANLATFLIVQELDESVKGLNDLVNQTKIQYGCMRGGSTSKFFSNSTSADKQRLWDNMSNKWKDALKQTNNDGIAAVREAKGKYAFFMESTIIEYNMERKCNLAQVGGLLDNKGYGIALRKHSPYLDLFNGAILKLQESGKLDELKRKWWKEQRKEQAETCPTASVSDAVKALQLANVGGVFVVLVVGCIASVLITCFEIWLHSRSDRRDLHDLQGESRIRDILKDLQFALQCRGNVKPVRKKSESRGQSIGNSKEEFGSTPYMKYASNKSLAD